MPTAMSDRLSEVPSSAAKASRLTAEVRLKREPPPKFAKRVSIAHLRDVTEDEWVARKPEKPAEPVKRLTIAISPRACTPDQALLRRRKDEDG